MQPLTQISAASPAARSLQLLEPLLSKRARCSWLSALCLALFSPLAIAAQPQTEPLTLICSTDNPVDSPHVYVLQKFAELLNSYSAGQIQAEVHYRGNSEFPEIRGEEVNVNMLVSGRAGAAEALHVTVVASGNAAQKIEPLGFLMLPYFFKDTAAAKQLFSSDFMAEKLNDQLAETYNARTLGWLIGGFRHMTNSVRPVTRLDQLNGLRIRLPTNRIMVLTYQNLGATVVPMNWADVPAALSSGAIDGQENPYSVIAYSQFWDNGQKYLTENGPFLWTGPLLISERFFQGLSAEQQAIVQRAGKDAVAAEWQWIEMQTEADKKLLISHGMQLDALQDKPEWIKRSLPLWGEQYELIGSGDAVQGKALVDKALSQME